MYFLYLIDSCYILPFLSKIKKNTKGDVMGNLHLVSLSKLRLLPENVIIRLLITRTNRTTNSVTWCPKLAPSPELFRTYLTKWRSGIHVNAIGI
jgi:hypothetical protein